MLQFAGEGISFTSVRNRGRTPRLSFELDKGVKNSLEVARILAEVLPKPPLPPAPMEDGEAEEEEMLDATTVDEEDDDK